MVLSFMLKSPDPLGTTSEGLMHACWDPFPPLPRCVFGLHGASPCSSSTINADARCLANQVSKSRPRPTFLSICQQFQGWTSGLPDRFGFRQADQAPVRVHLQPWEQGV